MISAHTDSSNPIQSKTSTHEASDLPPLGRVDIHSHLLPGIDDGCRDMEDCFESIRRLKAAGFVGSICTPHVIPHMYPSNTPTHIRAWTHQLEQKLQEAGVEYRVWPGGELRLFNGVTDWLKQHAPPTLADSRFVLVDFWENKWPRWVLPAFDWLLNQDYQPILAHPERLGCADALEKHVGTLRRMGVRLQGNFRCMTGEEGYQPSQWVRRLLDDNSYDFLAMDMHRPDGLDGRFDGIGLVEVEFGKTLLDRLTIDAPRKMILSTPSS